MNVAHFKKAMLKNTIVSQNSNETFILFFNHCEYCQGLDFALKTLVPLVIRENKDTLNENQ